MAKERKPTYLFLLHFISIYAVKNIHDQTRRSEIYLHSVQCPSYSQNAGIQLEPDVFCHDENHNVGTTHLCLARTHSNIPSSYWAYVSFHHHTVFGGSCSQKVYGVEPWLRC